MSTDNGFEDRWGCYGCDARCENAAEAEINECSEYCEESAE